MLGELPPEILMKGSLKHCWWETGERRPKVDVKQAIQSNHIDAYSASINLVIDDSLIDGWMADGLVGQDRGRRKFCPLRPRIHPISPLTACSEMQQKRTRRG